MSEEGSQSAPNIYQERELMTRALAAKGYRVSRAYSYAARAWNENKEYPSHDNGWTHTIESRTHSFRFPDGSRARLLNRFTATEDDLARDIANDTSVAPANVAITLQKIDPATGKFGDVVSAFSTPEGAHIELGEIGLTEHPEMLDSEAATLLETGLERAELELHKRRLQ
ncbi:MAG TPA: hypothetical protein VLF87_02995 [Patescibacteria group bacterium]|nr:hypothetical protein [Patescibacteria group bacterium]